MGTPDLTYYVILRTKGPGNHAGSFQLSSIEDIKPQILSFLSVVVDLHRIPAHPEEIMALLEYTLLCSESPLNIQTIHETILPIHRSLKWLPASICPPKSYWETFFLSL